MLTSLSHAKTLLVSSCALPVSLSNNDTSPGQLRETPLRIQPGPVVGLLLYAVGVGVMKYEFTVAGNRRKRRMRGGLVVATY